MGVRFAAGSIGTVSVAGLIGMGMVLLPGEATMPTAVAQSSDEERYEVDGVHSMVVFKVMHAGVAFNYGRFNRIEGNFNIDTEDPSKSFIDARVFTQTIDTANESRDNHLRSADFFNAAEYPVITFTADSFEAKDSDTVVAKGTLTLLGREKDMEVEIDKTGEGDAGRGYKQGFHTTFTIERSEFGMEKYLNGGIGDEVTLMVSFEGNRQ